jgi:stage II sporulation protein AA (anti-sigma F factor antagonist)
MKIADLEFSRLDGIVVARVVGEVDMSNADELRVALAAAMPNDAVGMVLDLTTVEYLDSAGIRMLYQLNEDIQARRRQFQVVIPSGSMAADVLRLAGVTEYIGAVETVEAALSLLGDR